MRTKKSKAILDATKVNPVNLHGDRQISGPIQDKKLDRLKPWLQQAKSNKT